MAYTTYKYKFQGKPLNEYLTSGTNYPYSTTYFKDDTGRVIQGVSTSASVTSLKITDYFNYTGRWPNPTYYEIADAWKYWPTQDELIVTLTNDNVCAADAQSRRDSPRPPSNCYILRRTGTNYYRIYDEDNNQVAAFSWSGYRLVVEAQGAGGGGGAGYGWLSDYATGGGGGAGAFIAGYLDLTPLINNSNSYYKFYCGERGGGMYDVSPGTTWYLRGQCGGEYEIRFYDATTQRWTNVATAGGGSGGSNAWFYQGGSSSGGTAGTGQKDTDGMGGEGGGYNSPTASAYWTNIPIVDSDNNVVNTGGHDGADGGHRPFEYYTVPEYNHAKGYPTPGYPRLWVSLKSAGDPWGKEYSLNDAAIPEKGRGTGGSSPTKIGGTMQSVAGGKPGSEGSGGGGGDAFMDGGGNGGAGGAGYFKIYKGDPRS